MKVDRSTQDLFRSILIGPGRLLIPALGYLFLYRVIIQNYGLRTFGLWSVFAAIMSYATLLDLGFSQILMRDGHKRGDGQSDLRVDYWITIFFYVGTFSVCVVVFLSVVMIFRLDLRFDDVSYGHARVTLLILAVGLAATIKLIARSNYSILALFDLNYVAMIWQVLGQIATLSIAIILAVMGFPLEGIVFGFLVASTIELIGAAKKIKSISRWQDITFSLKWGAVAGQMKQLVWRGRYLYLSSLGGAVREPAFRLLLATNFGLAAVGVYDIALRLTKTVREIIGSGFSATFPLFARLIKEKRLFELKQQINWAMEVVVTLGTIAIASLIALQLPLYVLWIGEAPKQLLEITVYLALWYWVTLFNIPFWYAALASHLDRYAALSLWLHTAMILGLFVIVPMFNLSVVTAVKYWFFSSLVTQFLIVGLVVGGLTSTAIFTPRSIQIGICSLITIVISIMQPWGDFVTDSSIISYSLRSFGTLILPILFLLWLCRENLSKFRSAFEVQDFGKKP
jgi:O-antigen/teichoic acid export membrane protein